MTAALFDHDGDRFVATELSRGPWDPGACHGGPVSALLARAVERADDAAAWQLARLTVELTRPVPVGRPLCLDSQIERPGRKVSLAAAVLRDGDTEVARVRALRIRCAELDLPADSDMAADVPLPPPEGVARQRPSWGGDDDVVAFHRDACEHRFVESTWDTPGPVGLWIRLDVPLVADEEPSGVQRVMAAADFGNGVSGSLPHDEWLYINPDLTVHLGRPPVGVWVGMRSASRYAAAGAGLAESELFDAAGRLGRSCQSLFVDHR